MATVRIDRRRLKAKPPAPSRKRKRRLSMDVAAKHTPARSAAPRRRRTYREPRYVPEEWISLKPAGSFSGRNGIVRERLLRGIPAMVRTPDSRRAAELISAVPLRQLCDSCFEFRESQLLKLYGDHQPSPPRLRAALTVLGLQEACRVGGADMIGEDARIWRWLT